MVKNVNKLTVILNPLLLAGVVLLAGCSTLPEADKGPAGPETLTIHPDGSMRLMGRLIPEEDVVIYEDGFGGEKAAVKVRMEPLHPPFYRDSIVVKRLDNESVADIN